MTPSFAGAPVDLRSDTLTLPSPGMRRAMARAEVGDDVWGEDPTVHRLEEVVAELLGKPAAVLFPSGTMANLVAVAAQTSPGDEVIADAQSHIVIYEVGGTAVVAGVQLRLLDRHGGIPAAADIEAAVRTANIHHPVSRLLCIENTNNRRGGGAVDPASVAAAADAAHALRLRVHCDGARLFNAAIALGCAPAKLVERCDTVMIALSKGLGAPVGSVLAGDQEVIVAARRWRKRLGGGMRQAGILAAAGLYAFEHNLERLAEDHANASVLASAVSGARGAEVLTPQVPTNMVMLRTEAPAERVASMAVAAGVRTTPMDAHLLRCVTHLGIDRTSARRAGKVLAQVIETTSAARGR